MPFQAQPPAQIQQHTPQNKPAINQESRGANSPNIVMGDHGTVNIYNDQAGPVKYQWPGFEEKVDAVYFSLGENGATDGRPIERLKKEPYQPFYFNGYVPITIRLVEDALRFSFKAYAGNGLPAIEVEDNLFKVKPAAGWEWNSNRNAFEVVNPKGEPVFQMIRKTEGHFVVNGFFATPGGVMFAGPQGLCMPGCRIPPGVVLSLKPLFRYPSWKFPGAFVEQ
jgi:hypothetical protein